MRLEQTYSYASSRYSSSLQPFAVYRVREKTFLLLVLEKAMSAISAHPHHVAIQSSASCLHSVAEEE